MQREELSETTQQTRGKRPALPADRAKAILDAAVAVFARKGYQRTTTKEIAHEAGVAEGTIYNYFPNKRALLFALIKRLATETLPAVFEQAPADKRAFVATLVRDRFAMLEKAGPLVQVVLQELATDAELRNAFLTEAALPMVRVAVPMLEERIRRGELRPANPRVVFPAVVGAVAFSALAGELVRRADLPLPGPAPDREAHMAGLVDFILYGLAGHPRQDLDKHGGEG